MKNIYTINKYIKELLNADQFDDIAINGIQVENNGTPINKIAFAVDTSLASITEARDENCQLLIAHHGIFWGKVEPITGAHGKRIKTLLESNIGLLAFHLPLDASSECGNNIEIARKLGLNNINPFAKYRGNVIGFEGEVTNSKGFFTIEEITNILGIKIGKNGVNYIDGGINNIEKIAIVSGGASSNMTDAIKIGADLFITGDSSHELYHAAKENNINVLFAGHYFTETFGIKALQLKIEQQFDIKTHFCNIPTGL